MGVAAFGLPAEAVLRPEGPVLAALAIRDRLAGQGIGTAMGLFQSFIGMILILASNFLAKRYTGRGIW